MDDRSPQAVAAEMFSRDRASQALGMRVENCAAGIATVTMRVREDMVNGLDICHGGLIFTLADSAFAFACNSHNLSAVAAGCSVEFLTPGRLGDTLTAHAVERVVRRRHGICDVDVTNQHGEIIAIFRGKSARIGGEVITHSTRR